MSANSKVESTLVPFKDATSSKDKDINELATNVKENRERGDKYSEKNYAAIKFTFKNQNEDIITIKTKVHGSNHQYYRKGHSERYALREAINEAMKKGWKPKNGNKDLKPLEEKAEPPEPEELLEFSTALKDIGILLYTERGPCNNEAFEPNQEDAKLKSCKDLLGELLTVPDKHKIYHSVNYDKDVGVKFGQALEEVFGPNPNKNEKIGKKRKMAKIFQDKEQKKQEKANTENYWDNIKSIAEQVLYFCISSEKNSVAEIKDNINSYLSDNIKNLTISGKHSGKEILEDIINSAEAMNQYAIEFENNIYDTAWKNWLKNKKNKEEILENINNNNNNDNVSQLKKKKRESDENNEQTKTLNTITTSYKEENDAQKKNSTKEALKDFESESKLANRLQNAIQDLQSKSKELPAPSSNQVQPVITPQKQQVPLIQKSPVTPKTSKQSQQNKSVNTPFKPPWQK